MARSGFVNEMSDLKRETLRLGFQAGQTIAQALEALKTRDRALARTIIEQDQELNRERYEIEQSCYTLIATQQPLAGDLREVISILLIAIELERIADHAKNIAEIVIHMGDEPLLKPLVDIPRMEALCQEMLSQSLDAFTRDDVRLARQIIARDDEIDDLYKQVFRELLTFVVEDPRAVSRAMNLLFAAHNLERIGDRITNIGERVIYAATGSLEELNIEKPI